MIKIVIYTKQLKITEVKMNKIIYIVLIIIIIGGIVLMFNKNEKNSEEKATIKYVSMDEIIQIMNENEDYIILDVRTIDEYNNGHIPNAICIPNETISEDVINKALDFIVNPHEKIDIKTDDLFQLIIDNIFDLAKNGK